jgi:hypothetical protein
MHWYINAKTGKDSDDGRSPETAFRSLQHAIEVAKPGDTLVVSPGAYDQDLPRRVSDARAAKLAVVVAGSD